MDGHRDYLPEAQRAAAARGEPFVAQWPVVDVGHNPARALVVWQAPARKAFKMPAVDLAALAAPLGRGALGASRFTGEVLLGFLGVAVTIFLALLRWVLFLPLFLLVGAGSLGLIGWLLLLAFRPEDAPGVLLRVAWMFGGALAVFVVQVVCGRVMSWISGHMPGATRA